MIVNLGILIFIVSFCIIGYFFFQFLAGNEIQLTDALKTLAVKDKMLAYAFKGRRHDVGDKLGFLEATVEFALQRDNLKDDFLNYLEDIIQKNRK